MKLSPIIVPVDDTSVIVPFDTECPYRIAAWEWVRAKWESSYPMWPIIIGKSPGEWCRPLALIDAVSRCHTEYIVIAEPDSWSEGISHTLQAVRSGYCKWAVSFTDIHRLTREATAQLLQRSSEGVIVSPKQLKGLPTSHPPRFLVPGGTGVILRRDTFLKVIPDIRFKGWGGDDECWAKSLRTLVGEETRYYHSPLIHLWHPNPNRDDAGNWHISDATRELRDRYFKAEGNEKAMRSLSNEAHMALEDHRANALADELFNW